MYHPLAFTWPGCWCEAFLVLLKSPEVFRNAQYCDNFKRITSLIFFTLICLNFVKLKQAVSKCFYNVESLYSILMFIFLAIPCIEFYINCRLYVFIFILVIIRIIMIMIGNFERTGLLSQRIFISENNDDHQHHCVDQDYTIIMIIRIIMIMIIRIIMIRIIMIGSFKRTGLLSEWIFISGQSCNGAPQFSLALYHHHIHYHHHFYDDQDHHTNYQHHYHHENH